MRRRRRRRRSRRKRKKSIVRGRERVGVEEEGTEGGEDGV